MEKKNQNDNRVPKVRNGGELPKSRDTGLKDAIPGINTPGIPLPAFNPPVPNRAWTAMKRDLENDIVADRDGDKILFDDEEVY